MSDIEKTEDNESLVSSFHRVESLIPEGQELLTVAPEMSARDALELMHKNRFSQLPVVAGDAVLGVFSYRSYSTKAVDLEMMGETQPGDLPVEDFLEEFEYAHPADDWNRVLRYLNQDDAFLVGHRDGLAGLVTTMDVLYYFQDIANPFIMLAEIELSLRRMIQTCVKGEDLPGFFTDTLKDSYRGRKVPTALRDMTFYDYITIITGRDNWPYFKDFFGDREGVRYQTNERLDQLRKWRNTVFHFRRLLEQWELDGLAEYREWLQRRVRAHEGRKRKRSDAVPKTPTGKITREEFLSRCSSSGADFFAYVLDRSQEAAHFVNWGIKRFSVRLRLPEAGKLATFAYCTPPDAFSFYHADLPMSDDDVLSLRQVIMATGHFLPAGQYSLKTTISDGNLSELCQAYDLILKEMSQIG